jgi:hypothetical protein
VLGHAERAVADNDRDPAQPGRAQVAPRLLGQVGEALDRHHLTGEQRQDRCLEPEPGADLQHPFGPGQAQRLHHPGDQAWLRGHLPVRDLDRLVQVRQLGRCRRHEARPRHGAERGDDPRIPDTLGEHGPDQVLG